MRHVCILLVAMFAFSIQNAAGQDVEAGAKVYKKCKACHFVDKPKNKIGPHLINIIGRPAGQVEGYKYSKAFIAAAEGGLVWTEDELTEYLKKPNDMIKGSKMAFPGIKKDTDIANLIAYLKLASTQ